MKNKTDPKMSFNRLVWEEGLSIGSAGAKVGISANTATKWARQLAEKKGLQLKGKLGSSKLTMRELYRYKQMAYTLIVCLGASQKEVAQELGLTENTVSTWIKGMGGKNKLKAEFNALHPIVPGEIPFMLEFVANNSKYSQHYSLLLEIWNAFRTANTRKDAAQ